MDPNSEPSQCDVIEAILRENEGRPVSMIELGDASGSRNVHTRIDELRHKRGLHIENTQETREGTRCRLSFYTLHFPTPDTTTP